MEIKPLVWHDDKANTPLGQIGIGKVGDQWVVEYLGYGSLLYFANRCFQASNRVAARVGAEAWHKQAATALIEALTVQD